MSEYELYGQLRPLFRLGPPPDAPTASEQAAIDELLATPVDHAALARGMRDAERSMKYLRLAETLMARGWTEPALNAEIESAFLSEFYPCLTGEHSWQHAYVGVGPQGRWVLDCRLCGERREP